MVGEITIDLRGGRRVTFDEVVVLPRKNGKWLRCVRNEPTPRENLPETTKYYHLASDVERIVIEPERVTGDREASGEPISCEDGTDATVLPTNVGGEVYPSWTDRRMPE